MRYLVFSLSLLVLPVFSLHAAPGPTPEAVMSLARLGAPQLALSTAQQAQAASPDRAQWFIWEVLRWDLLYQLKRWPDLLQHARNVPPDAPDAVRDYGLWRSAQASVALYQDAELFRLFADRPDLALRLLDDPFWLDNSALRRNVLSELAVQARSRGEYEPAMEYLLQLQERQP
jgi:hypothetical protein